LHPPCSYCEKVRWVIVREHSELGTQFMTPDKKGWTTDFEKAMHYALEEEANADVQKELDESVQPYEG
jgi:hypothetical protein